MITIVDYKAGNLTSVRLAFEHIGFEVRITQEPDEILDAERVVFPGVGAAGAAMDNLRQLGLIEPLKQVVARKVPFLGICIGMQLLFDLSEEDGGTDCLGLIAGTVKQFRPADPMCKIPQMGWNTVSMVNAHPLFEGIEDNSEFYFVHSYYPAPPEQGVIIGQTDYADVVFASAAAKGNIVSTQFHPERSGRIGLKLLENFCRWDGKC
ncbi:MAG: imidazole glycerol phosphate synthase subunit HisH [Anaerohalosphaera sp.]|nr:imidazole glycerol phosphate synthase subunit HisH [Anaerohalosphaera sp.]